MTASTRGAKPILVGWVGSAGSIVTLVVCSIVAGIILRLGGFVGGAYSWFVFSNAGDDSWMPMRLAYARAVGDSPGTVHDLFFADHVKFQYPPSSLLLYSGYHLLGIEPTDHAMNMLLWLSILATSALVFCISLRFMALNRSELGWSRSSEYVVAVTFAVGTLFFYPVMISWRLGQVQGLLDMLFAAACLCWLTRARAAAGVLIGVACLIKPQFSVFLIWALLRREHSFLFGQAMAWGGGLALSVALYGVQTNLDYLEVLTYISRVGEIFWDNTSVNGLVNRLFHPDETLLFDYHKFPPYEWTVHLSTIGSSILIIFFALFVVSRLPAERGSLLDFMAAAFCFTLASPVAWGHHFGIAMPIFAVLLIATGGPASRARSALPFLTASLCYLIFSIDWNVSDLLAGTRFTIFQSWRLFSAFGVLWLLYHITARSELIVGHSRGWSRAPVDVAVGSPRNSEM
jgi:alpha-1,2-mannosyltransferase